MNIVASVASDRDKAAGSEGNGAIRFAFLSGLLVFPIGTVFGNNAMAIMACGDKEAAHIRAAIVSRAVCRGKKGAHPHP